jgi:hypothetical protein
MLVPSGRASATWGPGLGQLAAGGATVGPDELLPRNDLLPLRRCVGTSNFCNHLLR